ncbi:hypothetical protein ACWEOW_18290 [Monashia sp. NPDC004114]
MGGPTSSEIGSVLSEPRKGLHETHHEDRVGGSGCGHGECRYPALGGARVLRKSHARLGLDQSLNSFRDGSVNQSTKQADVGTVMVHELGHEIYLNHPSACGSMTSAEVGAAMNPAWVKRWYTNSDDKAGAAVRK